MRKLIRFLADRRGTAIVEMAFVAPILAGIAAVSFGVWDVASRQQDMRAALDVAAEYYMHGGADDAAAVAAAEDSWRHAPDNAEVRAERICKCGTTATLCTNMCTGNVTPSIYVQLSAAGSTPDAMFTPSQSAARVVRIR